MGTEERLSKVDCGLDPPMQEVGCVIVCLLVLTRLYCIIGIVASGGRKKYLGEWASLGNRMVLMWVCSGPYFRPGFEYIKCALPALAATPAADVVLPQCLSCG